MDLPRTGSKVDHGPSGLRSTIWFLGAVIAIAALYTAAVWIQLARESVTP